MNIVELSKNEYEEYIDLLFSCFETGRDFEMFLNSFLAIVGFEEVITTKYVGDQGIDLTCTKKGFDINGTDTTNYYVQAKRYNKDNKVGPREIRDLKGTTKRDKNGNILSNNYVNIFITTSSFTPAAIKEATDNHNMPVILIDGFHLINMCIEHNIGFNFKPIFSKESINKLIAQTEPKKSNNVTTDIEYLVNREITLNDIRARILVVPQIIKNSIDNEIEAVTVKINGDEYNLKFDKQRRYLGGVTDIYRKHGLITPDNTCVSKTGKWALDGSKIIINIE